MKQPKNPPIGLRLDDADRVRLDAIMAHHGWDQSNMLRWLIREEHKRITVLAPAVAPVAKEEPEGF